MTREKTSDTNEEKRDDKTDQEKREVSFEELREKRIKLLNALHKSATSNEKIKGVTLK